MSICKTCSETFEHYYFKNICSKCKSKKTTLVLNDVNVQLRRIEAKRLNDPNNESYRRGVETKRKTGVNKYAAKKAVETRRKNDPTNESYKRGWETKKKNSIINNIPIRSPESAHKTAIKAWETKRKNGTNKHSEETKRKFRNITLDRIEKTGQIQCFLGLNETNFLDEQERIDKCKIERQYRIKKLGYIPDGYCKKINTIYDVYECNHKYVIQQDLIRQLEIMKFLKCNFVIIYDGWKEKEIEKYIEKFKEYVNKYEIEKNNNIVKFNLGY